MLSAFGGSAVQPSGGPLSVHAASQVLGGSVGVGMPPTGVSVAVGVAVAVPVVVAVGVPLGVGVGTIAHAADGSVLHWVEMMPPSRLKHCGGVDL